MIANIGYGSGFAGVLDYALEKDGAQLIWPATKENLARDMAAYRDLNPEIANPVLHMSLAIHPEDWLTERQWLEVSHMVMDRLGYGYNHHAIIRHTDEPQDHIHIIGTRIQPNGRVVWNSFENMRAELVLREVERKYGLRRVPCSWTVVKSADSFRSRQQAKREGTRMVNALFRDRIDLARRERPDLETFLKRLARYSVVVHANIGGNRVSGISFEINGVIRKGSQLGKGYSWPSIRKSLQTGSDDASILKTTRPSSTVNPSHDDQIKRDEAIRITEAFKAIPGRTRRAHQNQPWAPDPNWLNTLFFSLKRVGKSVHVGRRRDREDEEEDRKRQRTR